MAAALGGLDIGALGYISVGIFLVGWIISMLIWRFSRRAPAPTQYVHAHMHTHESGLTHLHPHRH
jgi:hypothetical protein